MEIKTQVIQFSHVTKTYGEEDALFDINLTIGEGEIVFIQGHSGAGKSTLYKLLSLIEAPTRGHITLGSQDLSKLSKAAIPFYRRKLGLIFQDPLLLKDRSVYDNVALPLIIEGFHPDDIAKRVLAALNRVELAHKSKSFPKHLSGGEQQRVSIARAIVHKPKIILADEPTGNLDPKLSLEIMKLFERFKQAGATVIIASHDAQLLEHFPYRKITLKQGRIVDENTIDADKEPSYV